MPRWDNFLFKHWKQTNKTWLYYDKPSQDTVYFIFYFHFPIFIFSFLFFITKLYADRSTFQIRSMIAQCLHLLMSLQWRPTYPSLDAFLQACATQSDPLRIREAPLIERINSIVEKLPKWKLERLPPPRVNQSQVRWTFFSFFSERDCLFFVLKLDPGWFSMIKWHCRVSLILYDIARFWLWISHYWTVLTLVWASGHTMHASSIFPYTIPAMYVHRVSLQTLNYEYDLSQLNTPRTDPRYSRWRNWMTTRSCSCTAQQRSTCSRASHRRANISSLSQTSL